MPRDNDALRVSFAAACALIVVVVEASAHRSLRHVLLRRRRRSWLPRNCVLRFRVRRTVIPYDQPVALRIPVVLRPLEGLNPSL